MTVTTEDIKATVIALLHRGCQIEVSNSIIHAGKTVKVIGACSAEEYATVTGNPGVVMDAIAEVAKHEATIQGQIERWKKACGPSQGYNWNVRNWKTDYLGDVLAGTLVGYEKGECSFEEVRSDFKAWAEAHKIEHIGVAPQIQPQSSDFNRMTKLFGYTLEDYLASVGKGGGG
jgi:hypothetical protein